MTRVLISESAQAELSSLPDRIEQRIKTKLLNDVSEHPDLRLKRLSNSRLYRARIGDYRAKIEWVKSDDVLKVVSVGKRDGFYK